MNRPTDPDTLTAEFSAFCTPLALQHFTPRELLTKTDRPGNAPPPHRLWQNGVPTALVLDRLRAEVGAPIVVLSGYRAPAYNRAVEGGVRSQHLAFTAFDVACGGVEPEELHAVLVGWRGTWFGCPISLPDRAPVDTPEGPTPFEALATEADGEGCRFRWNGGLGLYNTFVHLDSRGIAADWDKRS